ncbi:MAG: response regulator, partial [Acidobacteria bacterium]|nr:response regulator [Acidobacteriota bacterium]
MSTAKICIVDDDRIARETSAALLHSEGYELTFVESGQRLLESLRELEPDVILLDVMMPGMDG